MNASRCGAALIAMLLLVGAAVPAATAATGNHAADGRAAVGPTPAATNATAENATVNVTVGQQLSTLIGVSAEEVETEVEEVAFGLSLELAAEEERAEAIAERGEALRERAEEIREDYEAAREAFAAGELDASAFAQRLAMLNARANTLLESHDRLTERAATVSALELRAVGFNRSAVARAVDDVDSLNGSGTAAILERFTGAALGEIEFEVDGGLSIEVEREDGGEAREYEREGDGSRALDVTQAAALETARSALSAPANGSWALAGSTVDGEDGTYEFEFVLRGDANLTGEAEVDVDGSSGDVVELESETEATDRDEEDEHDDADEDEHDGDEREFALVLAAGTPAPNATVTVQVLADGAPAANVTVTLNDRAVATTGADGTVTVTLPEAGEIDLEAGDGEDEGELEFEFDEADDDEVYRKLAVDSTVANGTATTVVSYDGSPVANATVYANDRAVGTTGANGTVTFALEDGTDELELEIVKGAFEGELEYAVENGSLVLLEASHEGDGDKAEADDEAEDEHEDEAEADDEHEDDDDARDEEEDDEDEESDDDSTDDGSAAESDDVDDDEEQEDAEADSDETSSDDSDSDDDDDDSDETSTEADDEDEEDTEDE